MQALSDRLVVHQRASRVLGVAAAFAGCAVLALVDPNEAGHYPTCPTKALLGIDCPACGTLRGVHALLHGRVLRALDHNALLGLAVPWAAVAFALWAAPLVGRPSRQLRLSPRLMAPLLGLVIAFTIARNLPFDVFHVLGSGAT